MISFTLRCGKDHEFEGWFRSSDDYERQRRKKLVVCPDCGDTGIDKALMAPAVATRGGDSGEPTPAEKAVRMVMAMRAMRGFVEKNFDNVGPQFAEEARRIHYGETEERPIYGDATVDEAKELVEEGIKVGQIPWIEETEN